MPIGNPNRTPLVLTIHPWAAVFEGIISGIAVTFTDIGNSNQDAVGLIPTVGGTVAGLSVTAFERIAYLENGSIDRNDKSED